MNCCKPEKVGTKEYCKMLRMVRVLEEDGRVPPKESRNWRIEGQKRRVTRKEHQRLLNKFEMEVLWRKKDCGTSLEREGAG